MSIVNFDGVGFVYKFWCNVFLRIETILPFSILRKFVFKKTDAFADKWVVFHTLFSLSTLITVHYFDIGLWGNIILGYAAIRVLEIVIYQINVLLFHPYKALIIEKRKAYILKNPYRSVVLLGHNFIEVIFWFTSLTEFVEPNGNRLLYNIMDNTIRIFTFNYEKVSNNDSGLQLLFFVEVICWMVLTIISLAKFIGELPHVHLSLETKKKKRYK
ncbi:hypothetical protein QE109_11240 [Fusibacter bizertensis]|uniref:DUF1295 domain-containing protein n=1 Tax=Fusibacter bizertensis TaxID=1488331 RepID=A0ABT6NE77_9FIRM|nr:hypothetical protein [Fusibacter bizertensis]MDH8678727.1 hypothetical protein [Fusibacter bizertensis]